MGIGEPQLSAGAALRAARGEHECAGAPLEPDSMDGHGVVPRKGDGGGGCALSRVGSLSGSNLTIGMWGQRQFLDLILGLLRIPRVPAGPAMTVEAAPLFSRPVAVFFDVIFLHAYKKCCGLFTHVKMFFTHVKNVSS